MIQALLQVSERDLNELALALRSGRLAPPFSAVALQRVMAAGATIEIAGALEELVAAGLEAKQIAVSLELMMADRLRRPPLERVLELVTTGPEVEGVTNRDTSVVVRDLFTNAQDDVLVAGYAVYQGQQVFQALADRMLEKPELRVRLFLDIQRSHGDTTASSQLVGRFADRFVSKQWPLNRPLPELYYDTRSIALDIAKRACLHAKVVVVDGRQVFVSSANLTEAAQHRNIEVGVSVQSEVIARQLTTFFNQLLAVGVLTRVRLPDRS